MWHILQLDSTLHQMISFDIRMNYPFKFKQHPWAHLENMLGFGFTISRPGCDTLYAKRKRKRLAQKSWQLYMNFIFSTIDLFYFFVFFIWNWNDSHPLSCG